MRILKVQAIDWFGLANVTIYDGMTVMMVNFQTFQFCDNISDGMTVMTVYLKTFYNNRDGMTMMTVYFFKLLIALLFTIGFRQYIPRALFFIHFMLNYHKIRIR